MRLLNIEPPALNRPPKARSTSIPGIGSSIPSAVSSGVTFIVCPPLRNASTIAVGMLISVLIAAAMSGFSPVRLAKTEWMPPPNASTGFITRPANPTSAPLR